MGFMARLIYYKVHILEITVTVLLRTDSIKVIYLQNLFLFFINWFMTAFNQQFNSKFCMFLIYPRWWEEPLLLESPIIVFQGNCILLLFYPVSTCVSIFLSGFLKVCIFYKFFWKTRFSFFRVFCQFCVLNSRSSLKNL